MPVLFKRILFPTDFSDLSMHALPHVRRFVDMCDAEIHCIHVVDNSSQHWTAVGPEAMPVAPAIDDLVRGAEMRMERLATTHLADLESRLTTSVCAGRPFAEIIGYARRESIDLIVMATHGRGAIAHVLLGSTTEKVVRKAPCAVMTIRNVAEEFVMP